METSTHMFYQTGFSHSLGMYSEKEILQFMYILITRS